MDRNFAARKQNENPNSRADKSREAYENRMREEGFPGGSNFAPQRVVPPSHTPQKHPEPRKTQAPVGFFNVDTEKIVLYASEFADICLHILKSLIMVFGMLAVNLADSVMGSISITMQVGNQNSAIPIPMWVFGTSLSLGASAIQIILWNVVLKKVDIFNIGKSWSKLEPNTKVFIIGAVFVWIIDTLIDVAPISLLVQGSLYEGWIRTAMTVGLVLITALACGVSEILTANIKSAFGR